MYSQQDYSIYDLKKDIKKKHIHLVTAYIQQQTNYSNNWWVIQENVVWTQKE